MMRSKWKYEVIIYWSDEDNAYVAEVPELPGSAADGATYKQAVANVEVTIGEWIETARQLGAFSRSRKAGCCMPNSALRADSPPAGSTPVPHAARGSSATVRRQQKPWGCNHTREPEKGGGGI
jgi:predicted RNase H-like HicB family nuclease